jgi:hypothetical protein
LAEVRQADFIKNLLAAYRRRDFQASEPLPGGTARVIDVTTLYITARIDRIAVGKFRAI